MILIPGLYFLFDLIGCLIRDAAAAIPLPDLRRELDYVVSMLSDLDLDVSLCHGDVTHYNLIYNAGQGKHSKSMLGVTTATTISLNVVIL